MGLDGALLMISKLNNVRGNLGLRFALLFALLILSAAMIYAYQSTPSQGWRGFLEKVNGNTEAASQNDAIYFPSLNDEQKKNTETVAYFGSYNPYFNSASDNATIIVGGTTVTISTSALDQDSELLRLHVCKTNAAPSNPQSAGTCP